MNIALALEVVLQGLRLWNTKEANALIDKVYDLRLKWEVEYNKPIKPPGVEKVDHEKYRSNRKLDDYELQLDLIGRTFVNQSKKNEA